MPDVPSLSYDGISATSISPAPSTASQPATPSSAAAHSERTHDGDDNSTLSSSKRSRRSDSTLAATHKGTATNSVRRRLLYLRHHPQPPPRPCLRQSRDARVRNISTERPGEPGDTRRLPKRHVALHQQPHSVRCRIPPAWTSIDARLCIGGGACNGGRKAYNVGASRSHEDV